MRSAALAFAVLLVAGASAGDAPVGPQSRGVTVLDCAPGAMQASPVGTLLNNQWNAASAGIGPWRQCLQSRPRADGATEYGWSWRWPARDGLYAYPEAIVGTSPWSDLPTNDARFPRTVASTHRLQVDYEVESSADGKHNLALEFWLSDLSQPRAASGRVPVKTELMIWSDESDGLIPRGDVPVDTVRIDGAAYSVYLHRGWGDVSGGSGHRWTYIAYHALRRSRSARYDARRFIDDAMARGIVGPGDSIAGVELGNELVSGTGSSWIRSYTLEVE